MLRSSSTRAMFLRTAWLLLTGRTTNHASTDRVVAAAAPICHRCVRIKALLTPIDDPKPTCPARCATWCVAWIAPPWRPPCPRTGAPRGAGWPYASLVLAAVDHDLSPILLLSDLAEHTKAMAADNRVSLLFDGTLGLDQPLAGSRVTLVGRAAPTDDERLARRFLARHPDAAAYAGFGDFRFYRVAVERAHLVAGFGRIRWLEAQELQAAPAAGLADSEAGIVSHMNDDHADAVQLYAGRLLGLTGTGWRMTGIDAEGIDLRQGGQVARLPFEAPAGGGRGGTQGPGGAGGEGPGRRKGGLIPRRGTLFAVAKSDPHDPRHKTVAASCRPLATVRLRPLSRRRAHKD